MKIYFEDGPLRDIGQLPFEPDYIIDAGEGVTTNMIFLETALQMNPNATLYTNSIFALNNRYAWNKELQAPEVYIRTGWNECFTRIDNLTGRILREGHNLAKMYVAGEFGN